MTSRAILVLSGGQSCRMGQDKSLLPYQGKTLLEWQCSRLKAEGYQIIANLNDRYGGFLGPLAGIDSAVQEYPHVQHWVVVPVDMPKLSINTIEFLFEHGMQLNAPVAYEQSPLPIYLPKLPNLAPTLEAWLSDPKGKRSVYALHEAMDGHWLSSASILGELKNYNTPEQWQTVLSN